MNTLTLKGKGRVIPHKRGGVYVYVPAEVAGDSLFPFKEKSDVSVHVQGGRLIVESRKEMGYVEEAEANYRTYLRLKDSFIKDYPGKVAVIVNGEVICVANSIEESVRIADEKAPAARHRILWKIREDEEIKVRKIGGTWLRRLS